MDLNDQSIIFKKISCGNSYTIAITTLNKIYVWGNNTNKQLGDNIDQNELRRLKILDSNLSSDLSLGPFNPELFNLEPIVFKKINCGGSNTIAITSSDETYVWGNNNHGQSGLNNKCFNVAPQKLQLLDNNSKSIVFKKIICGTNHVIGLTSLNKIYTWGSNNYGQLGLNHKVDQNLPQELII